MFTKSQTMELKEFIKDTITQISEAVQSGNMKGFPFSSGGDGFQS